jgi:uncharacterized protein YdaU (DUF1376 family)
VSKKPDVWMPFFIGDYLADTTHLTTEQHGGYFLLLLAAWKRGGTLPNHDGQLASMAKLSGSRWRQHGPVLRAFFEVDGDLLVQRRLVEEYEAAVKANDAQKTNGAKGGRPRKSETRSEPTGSVNENPWVNPRANPTETPSPSPIPRASENEASGHTPAPPAGSAGADDRGGSFEDHDGPCTTPNPVAAFAIALTRAGKQVTSMNPDLVAYVQAGGTVDHLTQCAALSECEGKPAGYAIKIARRELAEHAAPVITGPPRQIRPAAPSRHAQGAASILGVNAHDLIADFVAGALVPGTDRAIPDGHLPAESRRLSSG